MATHEQGRPVAQTGEQARRAPQAGAGERERLEQQTAPALRQGGDALSARRFSHGELLQLQRELGNRAVGRMVQRARQQTALQRKGPEERSEKQRRVARAKKTIARLGNNLSANLDGHIFNALPADGSGVDHDDPGGLHAYTTTAGGLPNNIMTVRVQGSPTQIHTLRWRWNDSTEEKDSTMFPTWMPKTHVRTLIGLDFPGKRANAVAAPLLYPDSARTYIKRGMAINLHQAGDTVYPTL